MPESNPVLALSPDQREQIEQWLAAYGTPQQVALHCRIILAAAQGRSDLGIAAGLEVNRHTVALWRKRFAEQGLECLWAIAAGRGRKPIFGADQIKAVVAATLQTKPKGMTHWSCRLMAERQAMSKSTISNIWRSHNIKPHWVKRFKLSRDPKFVEKLTDVIGLYLNPPEHALVLCVDEKSQIQALDRTQPGLPLKKGALRHHDSRLQTQWHHHVVRRAGTAGGQSHRPMLPTSSTPGVYALPAPLGRRVP